MIDGIVEIGVHQLLAARFFGASGWFDRNENRVNRFQKVRILYLERPTRLLLIIDVENAEVHRRLSAVGALAPCLERGVLYLRRIQIVSIKDKALALS